MRLYRRGMHQNLVLLLLIAALGGCASQEYHYGTGRADIDAPLYPTMRHPQILVGQPHSFLDASDWIWPGSLLAKLILWDRKVDSHQISQQTIDILREHMEKNQLANTQVLVNCYAPGNQWRRLFKNRTVGAGWRYTLGILSVAGYTILPGRFFGGDAYNPYTNTMYLYSDIPTVALHEAGHAKDFSSREYKGLHAAIYQIPFANLYYEAVATSEVLSYLRHERRLQSRKDAYEILYPAYSTYLAGNMLRHSSFGIQLAGVIPGHIAGQIASALAKDEQEDFEDANEIPLSQQPQQP